jgi:hypothetical protein
VACRQRQQYHRDRGYETDETERKGRVRSLIQLPSERDLECLPADYSKNSADEEKLKIARAKRGVRIVCGSYVAVPWF